MPSTADSSTHRALASESRRMLLDELRHDDTPKTVADLAATSGLHVTTVRSHLAVLEDAGLLRSTTLRPAGRGRPATVFVPVDRPATPDRTAGFQLLAEVLVDGLATRPPGTDVAGWARDLGARWGPTLIDRQGLRDVAGAAETLEASFDGMGFQPERRPGEVRLHACPFADLAAGNEDIICELHLGMARGMLDSLDAGLHADELIPFAEPSLCILELTSREGSSTVDVGP